MAIIFLSCWNEYSHALKSAIPTQLFLSTSGLLAALAGVGVDPPVFGGFELMIVVGVGIPSDAGGLTTTV